MPESQLLNSLLQVIHNFEQAQIQQHTELRERVTQLEAENSSYARN